LREKRIPSNLAILADAAQQIPPGGRGFAMMPAQQRHSGILRVLAKNRD
jgi:hypothetical protein